MNSTSLALLADFEIEKVVILAIEGLTQHDVNFIHKREVLFETTAYQRLMLAWHQINRSRVNFGDPARIRIAKVSVSFKPLRFIIQRQRLTQKI